MSSSWYEARLGTKTGWTTIRDDLIDPCLLTSGPAMSSVASVSSRRSSTSPAPPHPPPPLAAGSESVAEATGDYPEPPASYHAIMAPRPYPPTSYARYLLPASALEGEMTRERSLVARSRSRSRSPVIRKRTTRAKKPTVARQEGSISRAVRKRASAPKLTPAPQTGGKPYAFRCANCGEMFSKRYTVRLRHFGACVRDRGNHNGVSWDSDHSCWPKGSTGPSGKPVPNYADHLAYYERNNGKVRKQRKYKETETDNGV